MHVKIIKSSSKDFWYNDNIDDRFDISKEQLTNNWGSSGLRQKGVFGRTIYKGDCEVLHPDNGYCDCREKFGPKNVLKELPPQKDYFKKIQELNEELLQNIKKNLPELEKLLKEVNGHWIYEDGLYRLYHQSYKCYYLQGYTIKIIEVLKKLAPKGITDFNPDFEEIYKEGTGKVFKHEHNKDWLKHTRPIAEAFLHARAFLDMAVKYGKELGHAPECLPSGWGLVLYLFNLR